MNMFYDYASVITISTQTRETWKHANKTTLKHISKEDSVKTAFKPSTNTFMKMMPRVRTTFKKAEKRSQRPPVTSP
ncbi:MAG: hypothetical protein AAF267_15685, partial [Deinococcota bacterium]